MKREMTMLVILSCLAIFGFRPGSGTRLLENGVTIGRENAPTFDAKLNSVSEGAGLAPLQVPATKTVVSFGKTEMKPRPDSSMNGANDKKRLTFKKNGADGGAKELPKAEGVIYSVLRRGRVRPSAWIYRGNGVVNEERLSRSKHTRRGGHRKIYRTGKLAWSSALGQMQKRILWSSPSPGDGN